MIKFRRLRWAGHLAGMEEDRSVFNILTGRHIGKRPSGRPRRRWEESIRMNLKDIVINTWNWVDLAQDRDYCECDIESRGFESYGINNYYS